mmetsp:Transcript_162/g.767  ORF Transcript_162/g.767 Transcript_162/m.767 type:complete len:226 (+) Transcript_162:573-1250(+)
MGESRGGGGRGGRARQPGVARRRRPSERPDAPDPHREPGGRRVRRAGDPDAVPGWPRNGRRGGIRRGVRRGPQVRSRGSPRVRRDVYDRRGGRRVEGRCVRASRGGRPRVERRQEHVGGRGAGRGRRRRGCREDSCGGEDGGGLRPRAARGGIQRRRRAGRGSHRGGVASGGDPAAGQARVEAGRGVEGVPRGFDGRAGRRRPLDGGPAEALGARGGPAATRRGG